MAYTNIDDPSAFFQTFLYTGNQSGRQITLDGNSDLQPDLYWYKARNANHHYWVDSSRGTTKYIYSSLTSAEATVASAYVTSFNTNGFGVGGGDSGTNANGISFGNWAWKCNGGTTASNTDGSLTSTVQANTTAGFSIVTFTTDGATKTFGHGLGVKPDMVIVKSRSGAGAWIAMTDVIDGSVDYLILNATNAAADLSYGAFTSSTFQYNDNNAVTQVAYCFAEKQGYSKFGKYVGNGNANGPFIYTGFKPAFVIMKNYSVGASWHMVDNKRLDYNPTTKVLYANLSNAEGTGDRVDLLSNGFKLKTTNTEVNGNGYNIIYMAFAENPFTTSTGIPTTAR